MHPQLSFTAQTLNLFTEIAWRNLHADAHALARDAKRLQRWHRPRSREFSELEQMALESKSLAQALEDYRARAGWGYEDGYKYDPNQRRAPAGSSNGGQWVSDDSGGGGGSGSTINLNPAAHYIEPTYHGDPDLPIEPAYPIEEGIIAIFGGRIFALVREALGSIENIGAIEESTHIQPKTDHGGLRAGEREISNDEISAAMQNAKETGNVTTKLGKYNTIQNVYKSSDGITVIEETEGRNAGKVITLYKNPK